MLRVSVLPLMPSLPVTHKKMTWGWLESEPVVAFSHLQPVGKAEVSPAALAAPQP